MARRVVVLAPMPLEMDAIVTAFGLSAQGEGRAVGRVGDAEVTAIHIGMGPALTRAAVQRVLDSEPVDHIINAGICGGLDRSLPVGTLINPAFVTLHSTGATYRHRPPVDLPLAGTLITTEGVTLDTATSEGFVRDGCIAVDMESAAVAEVCEERGVPWSIYRCISDRHWDGLLDERVIALTKPDGSADIDGITKLLQAEPGLAATLEQLGTDAANAARLAAEAAYRGCLALSA